ncbi:MAG TPA: tRNA adenosine(34) deaminase TadA [Desulfomicrobiaceae bacterium]|nr:tRNA adenosine(34) deaminase TadA [Desulfomicrobiaceae bacterium]
MDTLETFPYLSASQRPPGQWRSWEDLMELALRQADKSGALGEVPVGAILLDHQGRILGTGRNAPIGLHDPSAHAEINALRQAGNRAGNYRLPGSSMVVTLEPCLMCVGAMLHARVDTVIFGAADPRTGCLTSRMQGGNLDWTNHRFQILGGILEKKCSALLKDFFRSRRAEKKRLKQEQREHDSPASE